MTYKECKSYVTNENVRVCYFSNLIFNSRIWRKENVEILFNMQLFSHNSLSIFYKAKFVSILTLSKI